MRKTRSVHYSIYIYMSVAIYTCVNTQRQRIVLGQRTKSYTRSSIPSLLYSSRACAPVQFFKPREKTFVSRADNIALYELPSQSESFPHVGSSKRTSVPLPTALKIGRSMKNVLLTVSRRHG